MIYHIFKFRICGKWYRDSVVYSDQQFSSIMDRLDWQLLYNTQVFHYGLPDKNHYELTNQVLLAYPVLSLDITVSILRNFFQCQYARQILSN